MILFILCLKIFTLVEVVRGKDACPYSNGTLRRLGHSNFYIIHGKTRGGFVTQPEARKQCEDVGLQFARIKDPVVFALLGRQLEKLSLKEKFKDTWYWVDARFDQNDTIYYWGRENDTELNGPVFGNFLYRHPRPIGIGKHISYKGVYDPTEDFEQCLTVALPWPYPKDKKGQSKSEMIYGSQVSLDERYCLSKNSRHALCYCSEKNVEPDAGAGYEYILTESKYTYENYFNYFWIFGDRKYLVEYQTYTFTANKEFCIENNLEVFSPGTDEKYLIPHLKMWARGFTQSQFWTNLKYNAKTRQFLTQDGKVVANQTLGVNWTDADLVLQRRSSSNEEIYCVAMSFSYEFKSHLPCSDFTNPKCTWSFIKYVPANCNNSHFSICQHKDSKNRQISWKKLNKTDLTPQLEDEVLTREFGYKGNTRILRSKVKQQFGSCYCPPGYQMMRFNKSNDASIELAWQEEPEDVPEDDKYSYDYRTSYWLVDNNGFKKNRGGYCTKTALTETDPATTCQEWHFYLCEKHRRPTKKRNKTFEKWTRVKSEWRDGPQGRFYPLKISSNFYNLDNPHTQVITNHLPKNYRIVVFGQFLNDTERVYIELVTGKHEVEDIALRLDIKFPDYVSANSRKNNEWGKALTNATFPFRQGYSFELNIECLHDHFVILVDEKYFNSYKYRIDLKKITSLNFSGAVSLSTAYFHNI